MNNSSLKIKGSLEGKMYFRSVDIRKAKNIKEFDMNEIPKDVMEFIVKSRIYDRLENFALKEKLTKDHVKNIIKQVVYGIDTTTKPCGKEIIPGSEYESLSVEPKLTRAKKKMLVQQHQKLINSESSHSCSTSCSLLGPSGDQIVTVPILEKRTLVTTEFPDDDDDDEYKPDFDEQGSVMSDEESFISNFNSPSSNASQSLRRSRRARVDSSSSITPKRVITPKSSMSPCKKIRLTTISEKPVVQRMLTFSEEEPMQMICSRTRSKYPMTDTPLEYLEMSFNPPDITADMYETEVDDEVWKKFLLDFVQPEDNMKILHEDDDQVDPEYDLWADAAGANPSFDELKEELRGDRGAMIPKKEVNQLLTEYLDSYGEDVCSSLLTPVGNEENSENFRTNENGICTPINQSFQDGQEKEHNFVLKETDEILAIEEEMATVKEEDLSHFAEPITITYMFHEFPNELIDVLKSQLAQHVQLLTQSILMVCYDRRVSFVENGCKYMLDELDSVGKLNFCQTPSFAHTFNLKPALETVSQYDLKKEEFSKERKGKRDNRDPKRCFRLFLPPFPKIFESIFLDSWAFPYSDLLPYGLFWIGRHGRRKGFLQSEYHLITSAFSEEVSDLSPFKMERNEQKRAIFNPKFNKVCASVLKSIGIPTTFKILSDNLKNLMKKNLWEGLYEDNPFIIYTKTGILSLPKAKVQTFAKNVPCALKDMTAKFLPRMFFRMVRRYWKGRKPLEERTSKPRKPKGSKKEKIIIIQDGDVTKIVVPEGHTVLAGSETNGEFIPIVTPGLKGKEENIVAKQKTPSSKSLPLPQFLETVRTDELVRTVAPIQVKKTLTSSNDNQVPHLTNVDVFDRQPFTSSYQSSSPTVGTPISNDDGINTISSVQENINNVYFTSKSMPMYTVCSENTISPSTSQTSSVSFVTPCNLLQGTGLSSSVIPLQNINTIVYIPESSKSWESVKKRTHCTVQELNDASVMSIVQNEVNSDKASLHLASKSNDESTSVISMNHLSSSIEPQNYSPSKFSTSPPHMPLLILTPQKLEFEPGQAISNNFYYSTAHPPNNLSNEYSITHPLQFVSISNASFVSIDPAFKDSQLCNELLSHFNVNTSHTVHSSTSSPVEGTLEEGNLEKIKRAKSMKHEGTESHNSYTKNLDEQSDEEMEIDVVNCSTSDQSIEENIKDDDIPTQGGGNYERNEKKTKAKGKHEHNEDNDIKIDADEESLEIYEEKERQEKGLEKEEFSEEYEKEEEFTYEDEETENYEFYFFKKVKSTLEKGKGNNFVHFLSILSSFANREESSEIIFSKVCKALEGHPNLQIQFLLFFNSEQAKSVGKRVEHQVVMCAKQIYDNRFTPERINKSKIIDTVKLVLSLPNITVDKIYELLNPILTLQPKLLEQLEES